MKGGGIGFLLGFRGLCRPFFQSSIIFIHLIIAHYSSSDDLIILVITVESVQNYIDGSTDVEPKLPDHLAGVERYCIVIDT